MHEPMQPRRPRGSSSGGQFTAAPRPEANIQLNSPPSEPLVDADVLNILRVLAPSEIGRHFYLASGTGLTLQIRHRRSNDLDYFMDTEHLDRRSIWRWLQQAGIGKHDIILSETGQVDLAIGERRRKVSLIAYPFPSARPKIEVEGQLCADVGVSPLNR